jgi:hypothetical protein
MMRAPRILNRVLVMHHITRHVLFRGRRAATTATTPRAATIQHARHVCAHYRSSSAPARARRVDGVCLNE